MITIIVCKLSNFKVKLLSHSNDQIGSGDMMVRGHGMQTWST